MLGIFVGLPRDIRPYSLGPDPHTDTLVLYVEGEHLPPCQFGANLPNITPIYGREGDQITLERIDGYNGPVDRTVVRTIATTDKTDDPA